MNFVSPMTNNIKKEKLTVVIPVSVRASDLSQLCTRLCYMMLPKLKYAKKNIGHYK
jgi:hypothetical protein